MANNDFITSITENPAYQRAVIKLLQAPPAIRALTNIGPVEEAYATNLLKKNLELSRLGTQKAEFEGKLNLAKEKLDLEKTYGLGTHQAYYDLRTSMAQDALDLARRKSNWSNLLGAANLGVGLYGLQATDSTQKLLNQYILNRLQNY